MRNGFSGRTIISEKAVTLSEAGKYTVVVDRRSTKPEIKKEIESLYKVKVRKVNTLNYPGKQKTFKGVRGITSAVKRMIVSLAPGQRIKELEFDTQDATKADETAPKSKKQVTKKVEQKA
jgi:large subunit ribosomal protein L23